MRRANRKLPEVHRRMPNLLIIEDKSNQHSAKQESLLEQERFVQTETTFILRKNGDYMPSGFGGRSSPVVRLSKIGFDAFLEAKVFLLNCT